jgi:hypothetical protein
LFMLAVTAAGGRASLTVLLINSNSGRKRYQPMQRRR